MSSGFDLSSLIESKRKVQSVFTSGSSATEVMEKIETVTKEMNMRVKRTKGFKVKMEGKTEGRKGRLSMTADNRVRSAISSFVNEITGWFLRRLTPTDKLKRNLIMESMKKRYLKSGFWISKANQDKKKENNDRNKWFMDNGSIFLKELITDCNGKSIPLRSFASHQILRATDNFDSSCFISKEVYYKWYTGKIEDRSYMIKRFSEDEVITNHRVNEVYNDFVLSARMSNHKNFLKLLGFCLEFPFPVLVFEYAEHGVLNQRGGVTVNGKESLLPLNLRLKISKEIANVVTYLHMSFPKIIIHRDVKPMHVFLDKNWTAKLSDFYFPISLPEGKSRIEAEWILGTYGYIDPLYCATNYVIEYTDVYSFGICLLVFLTGKTAAINDSDEDPQSILSYVRELCENVMCYF